MKMFAWLRAVALLRRIAVAMERIAAAQELQASPIKRRSPKLAEVFTPSVEEMNEEWRGRNG